MVDQRKKGARGEYIVRDLLRKYSKLLFERVPASGALPYLKGDLYVPDLHDRNRFCIEVKFYEDSHFNDKVLTNKSNHFVNWWRKIVEQARGMEREPLLFFKYNRSTTFVATKIKPEKLDKYMYVKFLDCYVLEAEPWLKEEDIKWEI